MSIHKLDLNHYSEHPLGKIYSCGQGKTPNGLYKPRGLWVSVDNEKNNWPEWCNTEQFHIHRLTHKTKIILSENANIIHLKSANDIDNFTIKYMLDHEINSRLFVHIIDWNKVAQEYQGIIISPYCWERRFEESTQWYYMWNCASGCIWNKDAIERTEVNI